MKKVFSLVLIVALLLAVLVLVAHAAANTGGSVVGQETQAAPMARCLQERPTPPETLKASVIKLEERKVSFSSKPLVYYEVIPGETLAEGVGLAAFCYDSLQEAQNWLDYSSAGFLNFDPPLIFNDIGCEAFRVIEFNMVQFDQGASFCAGELEMGKMTPPLVPNSIPRSGRR